MGFSEPDSSKCRRHPNLNQVPGVCSSCLRDKLSKLNNCPSFNRRNTSFFFESSSLSSTPPYSTASATRVPGPGIRHRRNGSDAYVSVGMVMNNGLKKSRSVSCANISKNKLGSIDSANNEKIVGEKSKSFREGVGQIIEEENMKKKGFLKKLIHTTGKKTKGVLTYSKTMKETSHTSSVTTTTNKNKY